MQNGSASKSVASTPIRAITSTLSVRSAPSVPPASQTYEPLVKSILRHRLLYKILLPSFGYAWALTTVWSLWSQGGLPRLGLLGTFTNILKPTTLTYASALWLFGVLPAIVLRNRYLTVTPAAASSPSKMLYVALSKNSTAYALMTYIMSSLLLAAIHVAMAYTYEPAAEGNPRLTLFVKSKKHPYYLNGRLLYLLSSQIALAFAYLFRIVLMDRFAVRWKNLLHDPETNAHQYLLARFVVALTTVSLFTALNCTMHAFLFGLLRSVVLPLLYMMPIVPQFLRPFTAHFLRGSWTMTLFFRHWSLLWRSFFLCLTTTTCWEMAESPLDEPVTVAHTTADPVLTVVSGITSADGYFKHFAYAELSQLARGYSPAASARRSALFADQKYNPSMWACLVRDALLTLGKDYQLLLRRGSPEAPAPAPAPAPPKPELTLPATPLKLLRTSVLKPTPTSPLRAALDTLASDGAISSAADSGVSQIPELFRSMVHASPSAEKAIESVKRSEERVVGMFEETRTKLQQRMEAAVHGRVPAAALEKMTPAFGVVERVRQWWTRDRVNKLVEMSLPNRHLDALAISILSRLTCASLTEDSYGVVQRDIPKIIEALLSFLAAVEEYQAEISKTHVTPSPEELQNMSAKERQEKERLMTELEQAGQIFAEVNDGLKEGIVHIVRTFGDKLAAFRFPPRIAQKLQGYVDYS